MGIQQRTHMAGPVSRDKGFTLVELMMTLAVVAILVTVAIPGFSNLIRDNRLVTSTNRLVTSLALARSEAVKRGGPVSICASNTGSACTGTDWDQGWIVFTDADTDGAVDAVDTLLRVESGLSSDLTVTVSGNAVASFQSTGFAVAACDNACGPAPYLAPAPASLLSRTVNYLLPGQAAFAGYGGDNSTPSDNSGNSGGGGGGGNGGGNTDSTAAVTEFTICDGRSGETGRRISIWANGRFNTSTVSCGS